MRFFCRVEKILVRRFDCVYSIARRTKTRIGPARGRWETGMTGKLLSPARNYTGRLNTLSKEMDGAMNQGMAKKLHCSKKNQDFFNAKLGHFMRQKDGTTEFADEKVQTKPAASRAHRRCSFRQTRRLFLHAQDRFEFVTVSRMSISSNHIDT